MTRLLFFFFFIFTALCSSSASEAHKCDADSEGSCVSEEVSGFDSNFLLQLTARNSLDEGKSLTLESCVSVTIKTAGAKSAGSKKAEVYHHGDWHPIPSTETGKGSSFSFPVCAAELKLKSPGDGWKATVTMAGQTFAAKSNCDINACGWIKDKEETYLVPVPNTTNTTNKTDNSDYEAQWKAAAAAPPAPSTTSSTTPPTYRELGPGKCCGHGIMIVGQILEPGMDLKQCEDGCNKNDACQSIAFSETKGWCFFYRSTTLGKPDDDGLKCYTKAASTSSYDSQASGEYEIVTSGKCPTDRIVSMDECLAAAKTVGADPSNTCLDGGDSQGYGGRPYGCTFNNYHTVEWWGKGKEDAGIGDCGSYNYKGDILKYQCVCKSKSPALDTTSQCTPKEHDDIHKCATTGDRAEECTRFYEGSCNANDVWACMPKVVRCQQENKVTACHKDCIGCINSLIKACNSAGNAVPYPEMPGYGLLQPVPPNSSGSEASVLEVLDTGNTEKAAALDESLSGKRTC